MMSNTRANEYIDRLYENYSNCENVNKIFDIIKYDENLGIYFRYKCNNNDGFVITKILYPVDNLDDIQLCIVSVDKCKQPKSSLIKYVELPNDDNENYITNIIKQYLLENSQFCEV